MAFSCGVLTAGDQNVMRVNIRFFFCATMQIGIQLAVKKY